MQNSEKRTAFTTKWMHENDTVNICVKKVFQQNFGFVFFLT